jgi:hypothetical protein
VEVYFEYNNESSDYKKKEISYVAAQQAASEEGLNSVKLFGCRFWSYRSAGCTKRGWCSIRANGPENGSIMYLRNIRKTHVRTMQMQRTVVERIVCYSHTTFMP